MQSNNQIVGVRCAKKSARQNDCERYRDEADAGFSLIELLLVITIISVMSAVTIFSAFNNRKAYRTEDQALRIADFMREAKQNALSQRQTMRLEIDLTDKVIRIIDEETPEGNPNDSHNNDRIIRQENLDNSGSVRADATPANITVLPNANPTTTPVINYPAAVYATSSHPLSAGHRVWAARFQSNGSVTGPDESLVPTSATILVWQPSASGASDASPLGLVRAVTLFGGTGTVKYWQYNGSNFVGK